MFIDLREYDGAEEIRTDICIVGAGAAGISMALELADGGRDVCILESGGFEYDAPTQLLAAGENAGMPYYELLATRLRYFGGTTNHWAGTCRPLDEVDFEARQGVPHSGWPIDLATLEPYYERAQARCGLGPYIYEPDYWATPDAPLLPLSGGRLSTKVKMERPLRFGAEYRAALDGAANVRVYLYANVTTIEPGESGDAIEIVRARTLAGKEIAVRANSYVLAAGAIENARLLLANRTVHPAGIGNDHDLVGRYFMEHPLVPMMELQLADKHTSLDFYTGQHRDGLDVAGYLALDEDVLRREGLLNACLWISIGGIDQRVTKSLDGVLSAVAIWNSIKEGRMPPELGTHVANLVGDLHRVAIYSYERAFERSPLTASLVVDLEQAPNPESRVELTDDLDSLGMPTTRLTWRMGELEQRTVTRFAEIVAMEVGRTGLGRIRAVEPAEDGWWEGMRGAWHHMGTTRMHARAAEGVVDADCRVHGVRNLFIAGGSVFTTAGFANPTLTIVALAIRLADHLKGMEA